MKSSLKKPERVLEDNTNRLDVVAGVNDDRLGNMLDTNSDRLRPFNRAKNRSER